MKQTGTIIVAAVVAVVVSFIAIQTLTPIGEGSYSKSTVSLYDRVMDAGKIRCGYIHHEPSLIIDPNSREFSGIYYDLMEEIGKRLNLEIEWAEELNWGNAVESVKTKRVDMLCSHMWANSNRARYVDFTTPVNYSVIEAFVRIDDNRFDHDLFLMNNKDVRFITIDGSIENQMVALHFPKATVVSLPGTTMLPEMFASVATNKADVLLSSSYSGITYQKNNPGKIKSVSKNNPIQLNKNIMMLQAGEYRFTKMIDNVIQDIQYDGTLEKIIRKYDAQDHFKPVALPYRQ